MFQSHNRCVGTLLSWTKYSVLIWLCEMVPWEIPAILCIRTTIVQMTETQEKRTLNHTLSYLVQGFANQIFFLNIRWSLSRSSHTSAKNGLCPAVRVKNTTQQTHSGEPSVYCDGCRGTFTRWASLEPPQRIHMERNHISVLTVVILLQVSALQRQKPFHKGEESWWLELLSLLSPLVFISIKIS